MMFLLWSLLALAAPDALELGDGHDSDFSSSSGDTIHSEYTTFSSDVSSGDPSVDVDSTSDIEIGDVVMLIQMIGASATLGDQDDVDVASSGVGQYEFRRVSDVSGSTVTFETEVENDYTAAGAQVVVVPQYSSITMSGGARYLPAAWNGTTGGVLALFVDGPITMTGGSTAIQSSGRGFAGGLQQNSTNYFDCGSLDGTSANDGGGPKGEGITGTWGTGDSESGRGNLANGAGGGNCHNAGGGGGGGAAVGGLGGREWNGSDVRGGYGGAGMDYDLDTHLVMGGGGGAGESNGSTAGDGGAGGGIVVLRAESLSMDNSEIRANGASGGTVGGDGAGGGGGAGSILIDIHGALACPNSGEIEVQGGNGGDCNNSHGPGGGGAGGHAVVRVQSGTCDVDLTNGRAGQTSGGSYRGAQPQSYDDPTYSGVGDLCTDSDSDGSCDSEDFCTGKDYTGDSDSDGVCDDTDICTGTDSSGDTDGDGFCDDNDADDDGDTVLDAADACPAGATGWESVSDVDPLDLDPSGLTEWIDAADPDGSGTPPADQDPISAWADLSGLDHDWVVTGTATYVAVDDLNSLPAIEFLTSASAIEDIAAPPGNGGELFGYAYRKLPSDADGRILDGTVDDWSFGSRSTYHRVVGFDGNPPWDRAAIDGSSTDWHVLVVQRQSDGSLAAWDEDGLVGRANANDSTVVRWAINEGFHATGENTDNRVAALARFDVSGSDERKAEAFRDYLLWAIGAVSTVTDIDGDGCEDQSEDTDIDGDGVSNIDENTDGTDPTLADTDGDGVCDGDSTPFDGVCIAGPDTCPLDVSDDTDGDGVCDSDDECPGGDDNVDDNNNGIPDFCDNTPPSVTNNTGLVVDEGLTVDVDTQAVLVEDPEQGASELEFTVKTGPDHGTLLLDGSALGGTFTQEDIGAGLLAYEHDGSETTSDAVTFVVSDGRNGEVELTVAIVVNPRNDIPVVDTNTGLTLDEDASETITTSELSASDADPGDADADILYTVTALPDHGELLLDGAAVELQDTFTQQDILDGLISYDHDGSETTADDFSFQVGDGTGTSSAAPFEITITPVNDPPVIGGSGFSVGEGEEVVVSTSGLTADDPDNTANERIFTLESAPSNGDLELNGAPLSDTDTFTQQDILDGVITYQHDGSETQADTFDVTVTDGTATTSATTVNITIIAVSDDPTIITNAGLTVDEGQTGAIPNTLLQVSDVDDPPEDRVFTLQTVPSNGTLLLDGQPLVASDTFTQADIDAGLLSYEHDGSETTIDGFTFVVDDVSGGTPTGTTSFDISITPVNDEPVLTTGSFTVDEGQGVVLDDTVVDTEDPDDPPANLIYTLEIAPTNGVIELDGTLVTEGGLFTQVEVDQGLVSYVHDAGETTSDTFSLSVTDGEADSAIEAVSVTITPVPDDPRVLTNAGLTVPEGQSRNLQGLLRVADNDNTPDEVTYTITASTSNGTLSPATFTQQDIDDGLVSYEHDGSETTADQFTFQASDDSGGTPTPETDFLIDITPVNDAPVAVDDNYNATAGQTLAVDSASGVLANDSDAEGDGLVAFSVTTPSSGSLAMAPDGSFTYDAAPGVGGQVTFDYAVDDGNGGSGQATVIIDISGGDTGLHTGIIDTDLDTGDTGLLESDIHTGATGELIDTAGGEDTAPPGPNSREDEVPDASDIEDVDVITPDGGCSCDQGGRPLWGLWALVGLLLLRRRDDRK